MATNKGTGTKPNRNGHEGDITENGENLYPLHEIADLLSHLEQNLAVIQNYFQDLLELIARFEYAVEELGTDTNWQKGEIFSSLENFKMRIDLEGIYPDGKKILKRAIQILHLVQQKVQCLHGEEVELN